MYLTLTVLCGIVALSLGIFALALLMDRRRLESRLNNVLSNAGPADATAIDDFLDYSETDHGRMLRPITEPLICLVPRPIRRAIRERLAAAGLLRKMNVAEFLLLRLVSIVVGVCAGVGFGLWMMGRNPVWALPGAILAMLVGALLPDYWLQSRTNERHRLMRKSLPDVLDLLVVSVEAGTGFDAAMAHVDEKFRGPLADEFERVLQEMRLGKSRSTALRDMVARTRLQEVSTFVSAVCQAEQLGTSMGQVLRVQSRAQRERRVFGIKETAMKLPVKLIFPLILFIFPAIFVVIAGPGIIMLWENLIR